jgi:hypothetical protein
MAIKPQLKRFWKEHPFLTVMYGVTGAYLVSRTYDAILSPKGEFYYGEDLVAGIGSGLGSFWVGDNNTTKNKNRNRKRGGGGQRSGGQSRYQPLPQIKSHYHSFSRPVQEHWGKHPGGETRGSQGYTHAHMGATTSTSTSTSSSHLPALREHRSEYGDASFESPAHLYGLPNGIKRRIMHGSVGDDTVFSAPPPLLSQVQESGEILGYAGNLPEQLAGHGWL